MKNKKLTLVALIVAVLSLSIGFAAFSNSLNIKSSASVNPSDKDFKIVFSKEKDTFVSGNEIISATGNVNENTKKGSINDTGDTLYNLETEFTKPGENVEYSLYIKNIGAYNAVLNKLEIEEAELASDITVDNYYIVDNGSVKCYAKKDLSNPANEELLKSACNNIRLKVKLQQESEYITNTKEFDSYVINKGESESVTVTLEYTGDTLADTSFNVVFGSVKMNYATTKVSSSTPVEETKESCFISTTQGEINDYVCDNKDVVIPNNLSLPVSEITSATFNMDKCVLFDEESDCQTYKSEFEKLSLEEQKNSEYIYYADKSYQVLNNDKYQIIKVGTVSFTNKNIESLSLANNIVEIGDCAFGINNISKVIFPEGLTTIANFAFAYNKLEELNIPSTVVSIGEGAFEQNQLVKVSMNPKKKVFENLGKHIFGWLSGSQCEESLNNGVNDIDNSCTIWVNG